MYIIHNNQFICLQHPSVKEYTTQYTWFDAFSFCSGVPILLCPWSVCNTWKPRHYNPSPFFGWRVCDSVVEAGLPNHYRP